MRDFRELKVWHKSHILTLAAYRETACFPKHEMYGLTSQIRRAAVSVEANISEGSGKNSRADFARFLQIGLGSASELECELLVARDLGYMSSDHYNDISGQVIETKRMLTGFIQYLNGSRAGTKG
jgi:four helix bundle protein